MRFVFLILWSALVTAPACDHGDTISMPVYSFGFSGRKPPFWTTAKIDRCIAPVVKALNAAGLPTVSSCCGHGLGNGYILMSNRVLIVTPATNWAGALQLYSRDWERMAADWDAQRR